MNIVGVDIGGTSTKAMAIDATGAVLAAAKVPTVVGNGSTVLDSALAAIRAMELDDDLGAVGVGIPGQVDHQSGNVRLAINLGIGDSPYPIGPELQAALECPVTIENDVRTAALGMYTIQSELEPQLESLALLSIGTGISAGLVLEGRLYRGAHGMAGEIGHVVVEPDGPLCRCGQQGCLETVGAGPAIANAWPKGEPGKAATVLYAAAADGDPEAAGVASTVTGHLVSAIRWLMAAYDVESLVIGGGVSTAGPEFLKAIHQELTKQAALSRLTSHTVDPDRISLVEPEASPGPLGAAVLAARTLNLSNRELVPTRKEGYETN